MAGRCWWGEVRAARSSVQLKSFQVLLTQQIMTRFLAILLLCTLAGAQTAPTTKPATPQAAVNLNDSDNARKARAVLDQTIETLGGDWYLTYQNKEETGRYYPLYHGHTNSLGIPYNYYTVYPDKDRF
jgi:hypothetical protein